MNPILSAYIWAFERQTKANDEYFESDRLKEHDFGDLWLDEKLMSAALFTANVADECRDTELLWRR